MNRLTTLIYGRSDRPVTGWPTPPAFLTPLSHMKDMTDTQRLLYIQSVYALRKDRTLAFLITLLLGWAGGHHFYLEKPLIGLIYLAMSWTFVPLLASLGELFLIMARVDHFNRRREELLARSIKQYAIAAVPAGALPPTSDLILEIKE